MGSIKGHLVVFVVSLLVLGGISQVSTAQLGTGDGFGLFVFYDKDEYWIGDQVNLTIHVLYDGEYRDPDFVEMMIGYWSLRTFNATRVGTGLYEASVVIKEEDLWREFEYVLWAFANLTDGPWTWRSNDRIEVPLRGTNIHTRMYPMHSEHEVPSPGDSIEFIIEVFNETDLIDADEGYPQVYAYPDDISVSDTFATRIGTGRYTVTVNISEDFTENMYAWVRANVRVTVGPITMGSAAQYYIVIDALKVWSQVTNITSDSAELELAIMDDNGRGFAGATVELLIWYWDEVENGMVDYIWENGTYLTDHAGHLRLTVNTPADRYNRVRISGWVDVGGLIQWFYGNYNLDFVSQPLPDLTLYSDYQSPMTPGQDYVIQHTLFNDGDPVVGEKVFVYYEDNRSLLYHGTVVTDSQGQFSATLQLPVDMVPEDPYEVNVITGHFLAMDTLLKEELIWYLPPSRSLVDFKTTQDDDVVLDVGDLHPGRLVTVELDHPDADGDLETAIIYWSPASNARWELVNKEASVHLDRVGCSWTGDSYEASFVLPTFVTEDDEIEVVGVIRFNDRDEDIVISKILGGLKPTVILPDPPSVPRALTADQALTEVHLAWDPPLDDGGGYVSGYTVYRGSTADNLALLGTSDFYTSFVDDTIVMGETYYYALAAVNEKGEGDRCEVVSIETVEYRPPSTPDGLEARYDRRKVILEWEPPADDGGQHVTGYVVLRGDSADELVEIKNPSDATTYTDYYVEEGHFYYYAVAAINVIGVGERCQPLRVRAEYPGPPLPPTSVSAIYSNGTINVTWTPPSDDGGEPITGYVLLRGTSPGDLEDHETIGLVTSYQDSSVAHGYTYYYQLVAVNALGRGESSERVNVLVPEIRPPTSPLSVLLVREGDSVRVTWQSPVDEGGSPITGYRVLRGTGDGPIEEIAALGVTISYLDDDVEKGRTYHYQVVAQNVKKDSEPSEVITIKVPKDSSNSTPFGSEWLLLAVVVAVLTIRMSRRYRER